MKNFSTYERAAAYAECAEGQVCCPDNLEGDGACVWREDCQFGGCCDADDECAAGEGCCEFLGRDVCSEECIDEDFCPN